MTENERLRQDPALIEHYGFILDRYPDHEIESTCGVIRWKPKPLTVSLWTIAKVNGTSLEALWAASERGEISTEDLAQFYREIGYSLSRFMELPLGIVPQL